MGTATLERLPIERAAVATEPVRDRSTGGNVLRRGRATALTCAVAVVLGLVAGERETLDDDRGFVRG
jgi:hypothetical protein